MLDRQVDIVSQHFSDGNTMTVSVCSGCRNNLELAGKMSKSIARYRIAIDLATYRQVT